VASIQLYIPSSNNADQDSPESPRQRNVHYPHSRPTPPRSFVFKDLLPDLIQFRSDWDKFSSDTCSSLTPYSCVWEEMVRYDYRMDERWLWSIMYVFYTPSRGVHTRGRRSGLMGSNRNNGPIRPYIPNHHHRRPTIYDQPRRARFQGENDENQPARQIGGYGESSGLY